MSAPDYNAVAILLSSYGDAISASECHGILCAMASCQPGLDAEGWARRMLSGEIEAILEGSEVPRSAGVDAADKEMLKSLYLDSVRQLADPELGFQLLLPDDDISLELRTEALAQWCEGYLYGLALGGIKEFSIFSEPVKEFAHDLAEIVHLSHDASDDPEAGETAFFDITEYVRMGVLMIRDELLQMNDRPDAASGAPDDVVLH